MIAFLAVEPVPDVIEPVDACMHGMNACYCVCTRGLVVFLIFCVFLRPSHIIRLPAFLVIAAC